LASDEYATPTVSGTIRRYASSLGKSGAVIVRGRRAFRSCADCVENEIAGDVLVHLDHDALKDLDVTSVGHRLYLLKQIYNLKIAHGVKIEKDDYVPICMHHLTVG
jgi:hypothetical protein